MRINHAPWVLAASFCVAIGTVAKANDIGEPGKAVFNLPDGSRLESTLENRSFVFESDDGLEDGVQTITPLSIVYSTALFDLGIKTAHIYSRRDADALGLTGEVSTITDTVVSGTYRVYSGTSEFLGGRRITFNLNGDMNLPTGKEQLSGSEKNAVFDPFLVEQDRFGEGFNAGLGFGATVQIVGNTFLGFGGSAILRGRYSPDGDAPDRVLDPADQLIGSVRLLHQTEQFQGVLGYRIIAEGKTEVDRVPIFERGLSHEVSASLGYALTPQIIAALYGQYTFQESDKFADPFTGRFARLPKDNNGDTAYGSAEFTYRINQQHSVTALGNVLHREENAFDEVDFSFEPKRTRYTVGGRYDGIIAESTTFSAELAYYNVTEGDILGFSSPEYNGIKGGASFAYIW